MPPEQPPYLHPHLLEVPRIQGESIPVELCAVPQWLCWRYVPRGVDKKPDKQPVNPWNLHTAGVHWRNTWSTFAHAYTTYAMHRTRGIAGIGFVLTKDDPFVGVDLDDCLQDDFMRDEAYQIVRHLASYTEVSPSGKGLRIWVKGDEFWENARQPGVEIYSRSRFLTLTGHHLANTPTRIRAVTNDELTVILPTTSSTGDNIKPPAFASNPTRPSGSPQELWERIFAHDKYGAAHRQRFFGDISLDGGDHSLTVIRLLNTLARWTDGDAVQMRAMMLNSPLANAKWLSKRGKRDWLDYQIQDAIRFVKRGR